MSLTRDKNRAQAEALVLATLRQFSPIPAQEWRFAASRLRPVTLAAGQALTQAGETARELGFVLEGLMRKLHITPQGKPIVRGFGGRGSVVGAYVSLLTAQPSYLSVEALEPTRLLVLRYRDLQELYTRHTCWQTVGRRFAEQTLIEREARAHELLTLSASERYARFCQSHRALLPQLRSSDIASYLGISPVSLSRLRARERARAKALTVTR
jgi:CRP-like cAMP-binding protein